MPYLPFFSWNDPKYFELGQMEVRENNGSFKIECHQISLLKVYPFFLRLCAAVKKGYLCRESNVRLNRLKVIIEKRAVQLPVFEGAEHKLNLTSILKVS